MDYLNELLIARRNGLKCACYSCCSANEDVLIAAVRRAIQTQSYLLVEATSNQVNQFGGYTGMTPEIFVEYVKQIAIKEGLDLDKLLFGGDHLGPLVWANEDEVLAMEKAEELVRSYVRAGCQKIHLDTSMRLGSDDPNEALLVKTCARRGALLCKACEEEFKIFQATHPAALPPIYVIGSEVPIPGGEMGNNPSSDVTTPESCRETISAYKEIFLEHGLEDVFDRVAALVVEMGVEFSTYNISEYSRSAFKDMARYEVDLPISYEAHSTDYQTKEKLRAMKEDGAVFLKVGPAFTFAARSALFKLELIENELVSCEERSLYRDTLDKAMLSKPEKWSSYYCGTEKEISFARAFSFSDRCRYYFDDPAVKAAHDKLLNNLSERPLPLCLLISLFPTQYSKIRNGELDNDCLSILYDAIGEAIDIYLDATCNNQIC